MPTHLSELAVAFHFVLDGCRLAQERVKSLVRHHSAKLIVRFNKSVGRYK